MKTYIAKLVFFIFLSIFAHNIANAQTFRATESNTYLGESSEGGREQNCLSEKRIKRKIVVSRDQGANRLTYTMYISGTREGIYRGTNNSYRLECNPGVETFSSTIRFYIDKENATETDYSGTVIEASQGSLYGFKRGERITGKIEVFDGGRGLDFANESFISGTARAMSENFTNSVGVEQAYFLPNRTPDLVVSCKVISADGSTTNNNSQNSGNSTQGSVNNNYSNQSSSSSNNSCLAYGWQNLRKSVSVWLNERRCDGYVCTIGSNVYKWNKGEINRFTGQLRDGCYVYECDKNNATPRF